MNRSSLSPFPFFLLTGLVLAACGREAPAPEPAPTPPAAADAVLFDNLGDHGRQVGTTPDAQRWFDQGLRLTYGFNHEAAGRAFAEAARLDPDCAMCYWGQSLVLGPNINLPMQPEAAQPAHALAQEALMKIEHARPADRALIQALAKRYANPPPEDRSALDRAYAEAMAAAHAQFPEDNDIATLYGEALMDLTPWAYWGPGGTPNEDTPKILAAFEGVLQRDPEHIGAIHYYIHAVEASNEPGRAEAFADKLAALAPGAGHLVHMPAHVYIRVGRYHDATLTNLAATEADSAFLAVCRGSNGIYPLGYVPHNWHFISMTAALEGASLVALNAAQQTALRTDLAMLEELSFMQQFLVTPQFTQVRFGRWDDILATQAAPADLPYPRGIWHFARGMAKVRTGALDDAAKELAALETIAADPTLANVPLWEANSADAVIAVAVPFLRGELELARGNTEAGIASLREAVAAEDELNYMEPPDWALPVRPYLGAALLAANQPKQAAEAFEADLKTFPENGWSLYGLMQAQQALGQKDDAEATKTRLDKAWQWADVKLEGARL